MEKLLKNFSLCQAEPASDISNKSQEFLGRLAVAVFDLPQDLGDVAHGSAPAYWGCGTSVCASRMGFK